MAFSPPPLPTLCPLPFIRQLLGHLHFKSLSCFINFHSPVPKKTASLSNNLISMVVSHFVPHGQAGEKTERAGNKVDCHNIKHPAIKSGNHDSQLNTNDSHIYCQSLAASLALNFSNSTLCFPSRYKMITGNIKV